jgi:ComF family protein
MPLLDTAVRTGRSWGHRLLELLFPPRCIVCRRVDTWLCAACTARLPFIAGPVCRRCGVPLSRGHLCVRCREAPLRIDRICSVLLFEGPVRNAIHRLKYRNGRALAEPLGALMAEGWRRNALQADVVVPVPLHASRLQERGYNQAALLCRHLQDRAGVPVRDGVLVRVRNTSSQMRLKAEMRLQNVRGAFHCPAGQFEGQAVVLIDDVCTTGATLEACADALWAAGAARVQALTLARAP